MRNEGMGIEDRLMLMQKESPVLYHYFWHIGLGAFAIVSLIKYYQSISQPVFDSLRVYWLIWSMGSFVALIMMFVLCPRNRNDNE